MGLAVKVAVKWFLVFLSMGLKAIAVRIWGFLTAIICYEIASKAN
jgi:hypothetical protein